MEKICFMEKVMMSFAKLAHREAEKSVNSTCLYWHHQPKVPDQVKKLRKF